jgi:pyruvate,water dikinase
MYIRSFSEISKGDSPTVGGKGASLGEMTRAGFSVPPGFVITTNAYSSFSTGMSTDFETAVLAAFDSLGANRVAVRSSAVGEDSKDASWAGQFDTYLNVTRDELIKSIALCWQSASSDAVLQYAKYKNINSDQLVLAVVVQKMVDSEVAGVAFSVNPVTGNQDEIMIEAVYGLGELLVQGSVTPDNYVFVKSTRELKEKHTPKKSTMMMFKDGANTEQPVPEDHKNRSCLTDAQISQLANTVEKVAAHYNSPQDVEWALEGDHFYIVQSRPVTTL